ncbi:hypothetical protein [Wohlfahrtiimonas chitiniclastica]|uniref:hypothetical protein n=1 Tax=Wohlfahrtiimonas chitiniclastica TaxID=400946 RepID=UPI00037CC3A7|nr:hypothetical protein [Wohlfahrtiimonas chitiniclastica]
MSDTLPNRPNIFLCIIGWLALVIFAFSVSSPSLLFPISFVPVILVLLSYNLYTEHPSFRRIAIAQGISALLFCLFTMTASIRLEQLPGNLLDLKFNYGFMIVLTTWLFIVISHFVTTAFILVKVLHKHSSAMLLFLFNFVIFMAAFYALRWAIPTFLGAP